MKSGSIAAHEAARNIEDAVDGAEEPKKKRGTSELTVGKAVDEPARTVRSKHCFGLVTVEGVDYQIVDIAFRMLEPHELLRAQFGRFAEGYDLSAAKSKAAKVRLIGNSVCPELAEALVRANVPRRERAAA